MKKYTFYRLIRSIVSILLVTTIVYVLIYNMVPRSDILLEDLTYTKLKAKPDELSDYVNTQYDKSGYIEFKPTNELCEAATSNQEEYSDCLSKSDDIDNPYFSAWIKDNQKWVLGQKPINKQVFATREIGNFERVTKFYTSFLKFDHPWKVKDPSNPDLKRNIGLSVNSNQGLLAVTCSGCENKSLLYIDGSFPFIHQNIIKFNLGESYPLYERVPVMSVISNRQGTPVIKDINFETGVTTKSPVNLKACKYKPTDALNKFDLERFDDNYADCQQYLNSPSMLSTSLITGTIAVLIAYAVGVPIGVAMARKKGLLPDKIGMAAITVMISVPSLAFIYFFRFIGNKLFGLPVLFPMLGANNIKSYILPTLVLGLLSISGLIIWVRRYMIDQQSADYVKFAKAKGLSEKEITQKHIFRNAIIPITNGIPMSIVGAIQGATITETVFAMSGMGKLLPEAIKGHNNAMVIGLLFIFTTLSILAVFVGDILLTKVDPRISLHNKGGRK